MPQKLAIPVFDPPDRALVDHGDQRRVPPSLFSLFQHVDCKAAKLYANLILGCFREPHVEPALIYAILPQQLLVFVPQFHIRGSIRLVDRNGLIIPPATSLDDGQPANDAFALAARRKLQLHQGVACNP